MCSQCGSPLEGNLRTGHPRVALVGRSNVGKSTLFSRLAGVHRKMGNWPATTVEVGTATIDINGEQIELVDLPGIASLAPSSPDEELTCTVLLDDPVAADLILAVIDASNIARCLYLVSQVRETHGNVLVAVTMDDVASRRGVEIDVSELSTSLGLTVIKVNPRSGSGMNELRDAISERLQHPQHRLPSARRFSDVDDISRRLDWVGQLVSRSVKRANDDPTTLSDRVDRIATAPLAGIGLLLGVLWLVFQATTTLAAPLQDLLDKLINGTLGGAVASGLNAIGAANWLQALLVDGVIAGLGTLLTFLPVMAIMFLLLSILEDSGYMARAAVVSDRLMRMAGLPGRALLPLLVGFGCNVPAVSATRAISDARHRIMTGLVVPFTACSARLAVYIFVAQIFFGSAAGTVVFLMYVVSIGLVVSASWLLRLTLFKGIVREPLLIELPPYRLPTTKFVFEDAWLRIKGFLKEAGGIVVTTVVIVWLLMAIPFGGTGTFANTPVENSAYGAVSKTISPVFEPAGFGDWHTTGALITGFVAKEVVIASWAQNYAVNDIGTDFSVERLTSALKSDFTRSSQGHPTAAIIAFLVFLTAYTPCVATVGAQAREFGWKWAGFGIATQVTFAWLLAVIIFQTLKALGLS